MLLKKMVDVSGFEVGQLQALSITTMKEGVRNTERL